MPIKRFLTEKHALITKKQLKRAKTGDTRVHEGKKTIKINLGL